MTQRLFAVLACGLMIAAAYLSAVADCVVSCPDPGTPEFRGFLVHGWGDGYLNAAQTTQLLGDVRGAHCNVIVIEMRKVGDRYYLPGTDPTVPVEPKASNWQSGYADPLADIITKAHDTSGGKAYIEVHV